MKCCLMFSLCFFLIACPSGNCPEGHQGKNCDECTPGYHKDRDSNNCEKDTKCTEETCNMHGSCDDSLGTAVCTCDDRYIGDHCEYCETGFTDYGDGNCRPSDPCADEVLCASANRKCVNKQGMAECGDCFGGYYQRPNGDCVVCEGVIEFTDPGLEKAIREETGIETGGMTSSDLEIVTTLKVISSAVQNLEGLQCLTNLERLQLFDNQLKDIGPLSGLTGLTKLFIAENRITDIRPLASLTSLTSLSLWDNRISDISPLANLTNLTYLNLWDNKITDIGSLAGLVNLTKLYLRRNQIKDIVPLAGLTNLTELHLNNNQIDDIGSLANLTNLTELYLYDNRIVDIDPLANLISLTSLYLWENQIVDIGPLTKLTNLTYLCLEENRIVDIDCLANLTNLTNLYLDHNQIRDIAPLVSNSGIGIYDEVGIKDNPIDCTEQDDNIDTLIDRGVELNSDCLKP